MMKFERIEGFHVKRLVKSRNSLFIGYIGGNKFFIKKYGVRKGKEKEDLLKIKCELSCYKNLKLLNLPKVIEADYKNRLLVLNFVKFADVRASKNSIGEILDFQSKVISSIDASFLPKTTYDYYRNTLHGCAIKLKNKGIVGNVDGIFDRFGENKKVINDSARHFSHGDLHLSNLKYLNKRLMFIDLEYARRDNLMCDLAAIYADLSDRKRLADYFIKKAAKLGCFDKNLFTLMLYRRCIEVLYALKGNSDSLPYKNAKELINGPGGI